MNERIVVIASFLLFLLFQASGIYGGDSGDLVTAAVTFGVPHPPGYPFYTFLGWLVSQLPWFSPAWRGGLLSSIPHAVTVALVYALVVRLTKQKIAGLFSAAALAGNYLFFLYSITPEVFALFDLFVVLLMYLFDPLVGNKRKQISLCCKFCFRPFPQSSPRHTVPCSRASIFICKVGPLKVSLKKEIYKVGPLKLLMYLFLGLVPYLYLPIAGNGTSIINWNRPVDISSFIRLVTRADYGTFVSGGYYGNLLSQRITQVKAYGQFMVLDWTFAGIALALIGFVWLWKKRRPVFWLFFLALVFLGPGFFFYASFPLVNRFTLGTYERFLLPSYILFSILMGLGIDGVIRWIVRKRFARGPLAKVALTGFVGLLFLLPMSRGYSTIWRFWGIATDTTADTLGQDILSSVDANSIFFFPAIRRCLRHSTCGMRGAYDQT